MLGRELATLKCRDCKRTWKQPYNSSSAATAYDTFKFVCCPRCGSDSWYVVRYHREPVA